MCLGDTTQKRSLTYFLIRFNFTGIVCACIRKSVFTLVEIFLLFFLIAIYDTVTVFCCCSSSSPLTMLFNLMHHVKGHIESPGIEMSPELSSFVLFFYSFIRSFAIFSTPLCVCVCCSPCYS